MITDKPKVVFISALVFLAVACAFYLSTYLPRNSEDDCLDQLESDLNATTVPQSNTIGISQFSYSLDTVSEISKTDDHISSQPSFEGVLLNHHSENLTEADILMLIADLEKQSEELHQAYEEMDESSLLAQDELFAHCDAFEIEIEASQARHDAIQEKFEREVLGGRSVDEVVRTTPQEELEELWRRPESQPLIEACLQLEKLCADYEAQSRTLADKANALSAEAGKLSIQALEIDNDIADLKAMLQ